jgi:hypothetical protein
MTSRSILARGATALAAVILLAIPARAADPVYPLASRIGLVAPGAMKPSQRFPGFEDQDAGASILIFEVPPQAYENLEKQMTTANLKTQGMTEEKRETVTLTSGKGLLIVGEQAADQKQFRKWVFLASTGDINALIAVQVPDAAKAKYSDASVREALLSTAVRATVPIDEQLRLVPITFANLSGLRPFRVLGNSTVLLTDGANDPREASEQPMLIVSIAPGGPAEGADRDHFARTLFAGFTDFKDVRIVGTDMLHLDNQQTHEIQAEAKDGKTDAPMKLVQWVRFGGGGFMRFVGIARANAWTQEFPKFRAVRDGVKPRG